MGLSCARGPSFQKRQSSLLDTAVTGNSIFREKQHNITCQLPSLPPSLVGVVVGNYKMGEDDPDEVKSIVKIILKIILNPYAIVSGMYWCGEGNSE